ncbi:hypothetical protein CB1_001431020 [Camelus ferus]|nr:hypothetical protein CB1_001431020 [Camelus ferus]
MLSPLLGPLLKSSTFQGPSSDVTIFVTGPVCPSLHLCGSDITPPGEPLNKNSRPKVAPRFPKLSRGHPRETRNVEPQSGDL